MISKLDWADWQMNFGLFAESSLSRVLSFSVSFVIAWTGRWRKAKLPSYLPNALTSREVITMNGVIEALHIYDDNRYVS